MNDATIKELITPSKEYMATIEPFMDKNLKITIYKWTHEIVEGYGEVCDPWWDEIGRTFTLANECELAINIAIEELFLVSGEILDEDFALSWVKRTTNVKDVELNRSIQTIKYIHPVTGTAKEIEITYIITLLGLYLCQKKQRPSVWYVGDKTDGKIVCNTYYETLKDALREILGL